MRRTAHLLLLTWTAGALDGLSYISGHVFTANMTGNTVLLGLHLVQGETGAAVHELTAIASFAFGCMIATAAFPGNRADLAFAARLEFPLILAFSALWTVQESSATQALGIATLIVAAIALGIQSVAVRSLKISGVVTTFITGTITAMSVGLTNAVLKRERSGQWPPDLSHAALLASIFLLYFVAALVAGYFAWHYPGAAPILPLATLVPVMFYRA